MKTKSNLERSIASIFLKYTLFFFFPFCLFGIVYGLVYEFSLMALLVNPLLYSVGISLIIIVLRYDANDILDLVGLGKSPQLGLHIQYGKDIQEVGVLMSTEDFNAALRKVNLLIKKEPKYAVFHNLKGEILHRGFRKQKDARASFDLALKYSKEDDEQYKIATALKAATY